MCPHIKALTCLRFIFFIRDLLLPPCQTWRNTDSPGTEKVTDDLEGGRDGERERKREKEKKKDG